MPTRSAPLERGDATADVAGTLTSYVPRTVDRLQMDLPPTYVAYATQALLLLSFAGITYGVMSTNLEEGAEQSLLGTENFQTNLDVMRGVEDARIVTARLEDEEADALEDGIVLSQAAAAKRNQRD